MNKKQWWIVGGIVVGIPALALAWWLGSPLFLEDTVDEAFPMAAAAVVPDGMEREDVEAEMVDAAAEPDKEMTEPMPETAPVEPVLVAEFTGADDFHQGSGTAAVYELEDGSRVLRFESFEVTNGPDLHVILVASDSVTDRDDVEDYIDLGELKGNVGNQNYEISADVDLSVYRTVVIYCVPFHVVFATAPLG